MAIQDLITKVIAEDQFTRTFDQFNNQLGEADKRSSALGKTLGKLAAFSAAAAPVVVAAAAISDYVDQAAEAQLAEFNMASSVAAANKEFGDSVGTIESWRQTLEDSRDSLRIFSEQDLNEAASRLVDMTKRLGLNEDQMKTVLQRTADLSAGKFELADGVERVTAALRGEAESAEALGLSLSESVVSDYAASLGLVWSELSATEQAQLRYQVLLAQTNDVAGKAADFASTLAGRQAEVNAQIADSNKRIGEQLIPLYEGWAAAQQKVAGEAGEGAGIILQAQAAVVASVQTIAAAFIALRSNVESVFAAIGAGMSALAEGSDPVEAMWEQMGKDAGKNFATAEFALNGFNGVFNKFFDENIKAWTAYGDVVEQVAQKTVGASGEAADAYGNEAAAATQAAQEIARQYEQAMESREKAAQQFTNRVADLEFDHGQRMVRLQQEVAAAIAEAHAEAAQARQDAAAELASGLAGIEADLNQETADARKDLISELAGIDADRTQAAADLGRTLADIERDLAQETADARRELVADLEALDADRQSAATDRGRELRDIERDLAQELADLEFETGQERTQIAEALAADRAKILADLERDRLATQEDFASKRAAAEKAAHDEMARINQEFEDKFSEADPFERKILQFNKAEQERQLEEQKAAELASLKTQETEALAALQTKADSELTIAQSQADQKAALLDAEATRDRARLEQAAAFAKQKAEEKFADELAQIERRRAALEAEFKADQDRRQREAADAKAAAQQRYADEAAALDQRRALAETEAAENQARREQEAADARQALLTQNTEELAAIDEQEQKRIQKANEQIAREQQNYADRLARLEHDNQQTQAEISRNLTAIEQMEAESWDNRVRTAEESSALIREANMAALQTGGLGGSGSSGGGGVAGGFGGRGTTPTISPSITIKQYGVPGGFAGASQAASAVDKALKGAA